MAMTRLPLLFFTPIVLLAGALSGAAAENNKCIVTGDTLGGDNGPPVTVTYKGRTIRLCCKACVRKFNANPEKYLTPAPAPKKPSK